MEFEYLELGMLFNALQVYCKRNDEKRDKIADKRFDIEGDDSAKEWLDEIHLRQNNEEAKLLLNKIRNIENNFRAYEEKVNQVLTISEASEIWGKEVSTLRRVFANDKSFKAGIDVRKSGKTWLVTRSAMERVYGKKNEQSY